MQASLFKNLPTSWLVTREDRGAAVYFKISKILITVPDLIGAPALCCVCLSLKVSRNFLQLPCFRSELPGTTLGLSGMMVSCS